MSEAQERQAELLVKYKLFLYVLVNVSIPIWTLYFANRFPLHLKIAVALVTAALMNLILVLAFRIKEQKMRKAV